MAKTAIMTGASRVQFREIVKQLAADGCSVVVNYSESSAKADELRGCNVTANVIAPESVAAELFRQGKTQEQIMQLSKLAPMERLGEPLDIARVVSFLTEPDGGWVNAQVLRNVDVVLDTVGGETQFKSYQVLKPGGSLITLVMPPDQEQAKAHGVTATFIGHASHAARLDLICGLCDAGKLSVTIDRTFPLSDVQDGLAHSASGRAHGKILLRPPAK